MGAGRGRRGGAQTTLELFGLASEEQPAGRLAHGDERRLGVARALATEPRFLLLDEPAAGLPEAEVPEFAAVVRSVRDDHEAGVLLIDHNMALVMEVCDRIHVLDQGRTLAGGTPAEVRGNLDVAAAYLGEAPVVRMRAVLELQGLEVRYGSVPAVRGADPGGRRGRDRRADRPERRREVDDAAHDHGPRPGARRRHRPSRRVDPRAVAGAVARSGIALVPEGRRTTRT